MVSPNGWSAAPAPNSCTPAVIKATAPDPLSVPQEKELRPLFLFDVRVRSQFFPQGTWLYDCRAWYTVQVLPVFVSVSIIAFSIDGTLRRVCESPPMGINMRSTIARPSLSFEKVCQRALRNGGKLSPAAGDRIREDLRLRFEYAGEYVAYIDRWKYQGKVRRLCREVLAHSPFLKSIQDTIAAVADDDRPKVMVDYADDPYEDGVEVPHGPLDRSDP